MNFPAIDRIPAILRRENKSITERLCRGRPVRALGSDTAADSCIGPTPADRSVSPPRPADAS